MPPPSGAPTIGIPPGWLTIAGALPVVGAPAMGMAAGGGGGAGWAVAWVFSALDSAMTGKDTVAARTLAASNFNAFIISSPSLDWFFRFCSGILVGATSRPLRAKIVPGIRPDGERCR
jgi:hypothetical protein